MKIRKILIANRGEIALRIIRTCKKMGIKTVCIFTKEEEKLPHAQLADESFMMSGDDLLSTYLNADLIIDIAKKFKADAIHPGYGFLSEKAHFAKKVKAEGLIFIGPSAEHIELMGDKKSSKIKIEELNIPTIPGFHGKAETAEEYLLHAKKIGLPLLIKASAGGGGKGMKIVRRWEDFTASLESAQREAMKAFGDKTCLLEKYITSPRHIEVQVLSDSHGHHLHLGERECTIQRRYQKIIEESPSIAVSTEIRSKICDAAIAITSGINYLGVGTIELILDTDGSFYFLEMNTRLQVEHPVTEMCFDVDLVEAQILVAEDQALPFDQSMLQSKGHSLEVRLYAENPDNSFLPTTGIIQKIWKSMERPQFSVDEWRLECGYFDGNDVTISFDPMLAKLVVHASNRMLAISRMKELLNNIIFAGMITNRSYLKRILNHHNFKGGIFDTNFVVTFEDELKPVQLNTEDEAFLIASALLSQKSEVTLYSKGSWERLSGFRLNR